MRNLWTLLSIALFSLMLGACGEDSDSAATDDISGGGICENVTPVPGEECPCPGEFAEYVEGDCFYACQCGDSGWECSLLRCAEEDASDASDSTIPEGSLGIEGEPTVTLAGGEAKESYGPDDELQVSFKLIALDGDEPADVVIALSGNDAVELTESNLSYDGVDEDGVEVSFTFKIRSDANTGIGRVSMDVDAFGYTGVSRVFTVDVVNERPRLRLRDLRMVTPGGDYSAAALLEVEPGAAVDLMGEIGHTGSETLHEVQLSFSTPNPGAISFSQQTITIGDLAPPRAEGAEPPEGDDEETPGTAPAQIQYSQFRVRAQIADVPSTYEPIVEVEASSAAQVIGDSIEAEFKITAPPALQLLGEIDFDVHHQDARTQCPGIANVDLSPFNDPEYDPCPPGSNHPDGAFGCFCDNLAADCNLDTTVGTATLTFTLKNNSDEAMSGLSLILASSMHYCEEDDSTPPCGQANAPDACHDGPLATAADDNPTEIEPEGTAEFSVELEFTQITGLAFSLQIKVMDEDGYEHVRIGPDRYNRVP